MYDVVIIGAGVTGCAIARFLSAYRGSFCVLERSEDVCTGTSKANSAIIHAGFDAAHGSLMAKYNLIGNKMYPGLAKELDFPYKNNGSLVLALHEEDIHKLEDLMENGKKNGVEGLEIVGRERLKELEPAVGHVPVAALYAPTAGIICPFGATIAFAERLALCARCPAKSSVESWFSGSSPLLSKYSAHFSSVSQYSAA